MSCHSAKIVVVSKNYLCRLLFLELFFFFFFFFLSGDRLWEGDLAGEQINMNSSEDHLFSCLPLSLFISGNMTKGVQQYISLQSHLILGTDLFLFLFRSDFLFFFFPLGRGETSSSKEGLQAETEQRGHRSVHSIDGMWNVKSQLEELSWVKNQFWGGLDTAFWIPVLYFWIQFAQSEC